MDAAGKRLGLPSLTVIGFDARMTEEAGERYAGLDRFECRKKVLADLEEHIAAHPEWGIAGGADAFKAAELRRHAAAVDALQQAQLARLEPGEVAVGAAQGCSSSTSSGRMPKTNGRPTCAAAFLARASSSEIRSGRPGLPASTNTNWLPAGATVPAKKFIGGLPMNPATKRFSGWW